MAIQIKDPTTGEMRDATPDEAATVGIMGVGLLVSFIGVLVALYAVFLTI